MPIRPVAVALVCALGVSACASLPGKGPTASSNGLTVDSSPLPPPRPVTRADAAVARASVELANYCGLTIAALNAVELFASPKVAQAAEYAETVVETVCASRPSDVSSALATLGRAYAAVVAASQE